MKYVIDDTTLKRLADAIREVSGTDREYTPVEMIEAVTTILENGAYILVDENGIEVPAVFVSNDEAFTATENDIRIGTTAVTEKGVTEGTKEIPSYHTSEGYRAVTNGSKFTIPITAYDYTKLQCIICSFSSSFAKSVAAQKVAVENNVYAVGSTVSEASVTVNEESGYIDLGITNNTGSTCVLRYFTYKEVQ